jgi:hypothetical protein
VVGCEARLYVLYLKALYFSSVVLLVVGLTWVGIDLIYYEDVLFIPFWAFTVVVSVIAWIELWRNLREHIREFERERSSVHSRGQVV